MYSIVNKTCYLEVSRISGDGYWLGNGQEQVMQGTALGMDCTTVIFIPSREGMTGKYNRETEQWSEIVDNTQKPFWNQNGLEQRVDTPESDFPEWAIFEKPPKYNRQKETINFEDGQWVVYENRLGEPYYDEWGNELRVTEYNFKLPDSHTFLKPFKPAEGYAIRLVDGQWKELADHLGKTAYAKDASQPDITISQLGEIPDGYTLKERGKFTTWDETVNDWVYSQALERPIKVDEEKQWRNMVLKEVLDRIDQYEKDQNYEPHYRTSPLSETEYLGLLGYRKLLCDYPDSDGFPFGERPVLSYPEPIAEPPKPTMMQRVLNKVKPR
ncbi:hypothetical protein RND59_19795 [Vibrio ruber]|uniref:Uncharacterized protein n=1 Tax=Vibrio ruber (strain DSM 16370 / JCM 11486 / BCRC 17186 / CECT 7878 / LMG 23124 / VR1) TaxID=1123498 RepID=A0A1R4LQM1_VIBR1|nr:hypothetical protein [Vibrio ruber]WNJ97445.1 hypothetical protein RND59_19795 [Vibrio ruber]SJN58743.1 hypothetical protein VR7878_03016 [Vibrio ruber DSM 16370]